MRRRIIIRTTDNVAAGIGAGIAALFIAGIAAFIRHCWWTLTLLMSDAPLTAGKAVLAVLGIVFPPLGALHGVWLWFN